MSTIVLPIRFQLPKIWVKMQWKIAFQEFRLRKNNYSKLKKRINFVKVNECSLASNIQTLRLMSMILMMRIRKNSNSLYYSRSRKINKHANLSLTIAKRISNPIKPFKNTYLKIAKRKQAQICLS